MRIKSSLTRATAALTVAALVAAGAGHAVMAQGDSLKLWRIWNECASEWEGVTELGADVNVCAVQQILANKWNADHPELPVETTALVWPGTVELNAALAANTPPDIFGMHAFRIPAYASKGALTPLTPYLEEAGIDADDLVPAVRDAVTYNGELYAIPIDVHGALWHINLDLWEKAGLVDENGAPMLPAGREEFEAACEAVLEATDSPILGAAEDDIIATAWIWASLLGQNGGTVVDEDGMPNVNTPEALEALNTFLEMREKGCFGTGEIGATHQAFINGEVASVVGGTWSVNEWDAQVANPDAALKRYYVAPFPQIGDQPASWAGSHVFVVPLGPDADPERVKAALSYLKYFWDRNLDWTRTGHATSRESVAASPEYQALPHHSEYLAFAETGIHNPSEVWSVGYDPIMHEEIQAALLGQKTPEQALADAQERLNDVAMFS